MNENITKEREKKERIKKKWRQIQEYERIVKGRS